MELMHREDMIQNLATGQKSMRLSDGTQIAFPAVQRKVTKGHMYTVYENQGGQACPPTCRADQFYWHSKFVLLVLGIADMVATAMVVYLAF